MKRLKSTLLFLVCLSYCSFPGLPAGSPDSPESKLSRIIRPSELKEDLDFLFNKIEEIHPNPYAYITKEEFMRLPQGLYSQIDRPHSRVEFYRLTAPVVAALRNGHTFISPFLEEFQAYAKSGGSLFPLDLSRRDSKIVPARNYSGAALPPDCEITAINHRSMAELAESLSRCFAAEGKSRNPALIANGNLLRCFLWLEFRSVATWHVDVKAPTGKKTTCSIPSLRLGEFEKEGSGSGGERGYHYRHIPEHSVGLLVLNSWPDPEAFKSFLKKIFTDTRDTRTSSLIIDIRDNPGGSDLSVSSLMEYLATKDYRLHEKCVIKISSHLPPDQIEMLRRELPQAFANKKDGDLVTLDLPFKHPADNPLRFNGPIFVLTNQASGSASTIFAGVMKCFQIATLIGEETGDPTTIYADPVPVKLPHSGLQLMVASKQMVVAGGSGDGQGVLPDYKVTQTAKDAAKGVDTVLEFAIGLTEKSGR